MSTAPGVRLSPMDAAFLDVEDATNGMHLLGVLVFDGPAPAEHEFRRAIAGRLGELPRFRQRVLRVPFAIARPVWVDDPDFDLDRHVGVVDVDEPGDDDALERLADRLHQRRLDPAHPLWDVRLVTGLSDDRFALAITLHHSMADGLSIMDVLATLFTLEPDADPPSPPEPWRPAPVPTRTALALAGTRELVAGLGTALRTVARTPGALVHAARSARRVLAMIGQAERTPLTGGVPSADRRTRRLAVPLDELKQLRRGLDATVNDVVLALIAGALRRHLQRTGAATPPIHPFVPVNLRPTSARGDLGNRIGLTFPRLPVDLAAPLDRVAAVRAVTAREQQLAQAADTARVIELGGLLPAFLSRPVNRYIQLRARVFSTTCTNVPGPPVPVYFCGRPMRSILGSAPTTAEHAMTIAALSYDGTMFFSVTVDPARLPGGADLVDDIAAELDELRRAVG